MEASASVADVLPNRTKSERVKPRDRLGNKSSSVHAVCTMRWSAAFIAARMDSHRARVAVSSGAVTSMSLREASASSNAVGGGTRKIPGAQLPIVPRLTTPSGRRSCQHETERHQAPGIESREKMAGERLAEDEKEARQREEVGALRVRRQYHRIHERTERQRRHRRNTTTSPFYAPSQGRGPE